MEALRDLADDFNVRDPRKLYRLARQRDLDVTQAMAFEALKADVGRQVNLIDFSQNTRGKTKYGLVVMDVFTREAAVEPLQNKNAETVGRATKRAAKELTGDDGNFVVTTDLGNEFATLDRELPENAVHRADGGRRELRGHDGPGQRVRHAGQGAARKCRAPHEAARGPQRHRRGGPGHPDAEEGPGHEGGAQGRAVERPLSADRFGLQRAAPRDGARRARGRGEAAGHGVQGPPRQRRQVPAQQGPHRAAREGRGGRGRLPSADERGEELQPSVRRRAAAGAVDSMTVRSTEGRQTLLKLALPAPQGSGNAAGRLTRRGRPAAVRQLDDFLGPPRPRTLD